MPGQRDEGFEPGKGGLESSSASSYHMTLDRLLACSALAFPTDASSRTNADKRQEELRVTVPLATLSPHEIFSVPSRICSGFQLSGKQSCLDLLLPPCSSCHWCGETWKVLEGFYLPLPFGELLLLQGMSKLWQQGTVFYPSLGALQLCPLRCLPALLRVPGLGSQPK